ncbi:glycyl-radical enzyme activating protein [Bacteroidia bacterium]|nr:glycyl-radical enzyme activating protein [Bacteroidia bacterium]
MNMNNTAVVFDVKHYAIYDGPGIRTTVFFKGCTLNCLWCQNPESIGCDAAIAFEPAKCIGCHRCMENCVALDLQTGQRLRSRCIACYQCVDGCSSGALKRQGLEYTPRQLYDLVRIDAPFHKKTGGVTCSGGEAMTYSDFLMEFLGLCKQGGTGTVIDTAGNVPWDAFQKVIGLCDLFLYDLKIFNPEEHKHYTGVDNGRILDNVKRLYQAKANLVIRIPLIPGITDTSENLRMIADFVAEELPGTVVTLLPYNRLAETKYIAARFFDDNIPKAYRLPGLVEQSKEQKLSMLSIFQKKGIQASVINLDVHE